MKSFPNVWACPPKEIIIQAKKQFALHSLLPSDPTLWAEKKKEVLQKLKKAIRFHADHSLPLDVEYTGTIHRKGYRMN